MGSKLREIGAVAVEPALTWRLGCTGKKAFASLALALHVSQRRNRFRRDKGREAGEPYRCGHCGQHHIGSPQLAPTNPAVFGR